MPSARAVSTLATRVPSPCWRNEFAETHEEKSAKLARLETDCRFVSSLRTTTFDNKACVTYAFSRHVCALPLATHQEFVHSSHHLVQDVCRAIHRADAGHDNDRISRTHGIELVGRRAYQLGHTGRNVRSDSTRTRRAGNRPGAPAQAASSTFRDRQHRNRQTHTSPGC